MSQGVVSYLEIGSGADPAKSANFFGQLFDWPFNAMDGGNGWFQANGIRAGLHPNDPAPGITAFFAVDDLEAAVARVRELGGTASAPGQEEPGFGRFSLCSDPQGVAFGLHAREFQR